MIYACTENCKCFKWRSRTGGIRSLCRLSTQHLINAARYFGRKIMCRATEGKDSPGMRERVQAVLAEIDRRHKLDQTLKELVGDQNAEE